MNGFTTCSPIACLSGFLRSSQGHATHDIMLSVNDSICHKLGLRCHVGTSPSVLFFPL